MRLTSFSASQKVLTQSRAQKEVLWQSQGRRRQARLLGTFLFSSEVLRSVELFFITYPYLSRMLWKAGRGWAVVCPSLGPGPQPPKPEHRRPRSKTPGASEVPPGFSLVFWPRCCSQRPRVAFVLSRV